jgi:arylsulfatase A-like enzyme
MRRATQVRRRHIVWVCGLVLAMLISQRVDVAAAREGTPDQQQLVKPPNIVFIIMDDVGVDQMRSFGYTEANQPRTPTIDTLARAGVRFRNAWATPECSPSRVAFFTGRYPLRTGVVNVSVTTDLANSQISPFEATTPRVLRQRGYKSGLFGKWHLTETPSNDANGNPNPGNPSGNAAPRDLGWDAYAGTLEGAPRAIDTTAGGVAPAGTYSCGFVNDASFGACYTSDGACTSIGNAADPPGPTAGLTCLQRGGILVPQAACQAAVPSQVNFAAFNGYYVAPLTINHEDGRVEVVTGLDDHGQLKTPTDPRARYYLTTQQTDAALMWVNLQPPGTPWMLTMAYSAAHLPVQPPPRALLPPDSVDSGRFDCSGTGEDTAKSLVELRTLFNQTMEAMDTEIARLLIELGLATRTPNGGLDYRPEQTNTMVVIVSDNGSYFNTVRAPFDFTRAKGTPYQTGVWVPMIVAGPLVAPEKVGSEVSHMVSAAVDVFALFGEVAGIDVRQAVPRSHLLDAQPLLPYLTGDTEVSIRTSNFTQTGTTLKAPGIIPPCVLLMGPTKICTQIFTFQEVCQTQGGIWYGNLQNCCQVQQQDPSVTILPHDAWTIRDDVFKLVRLQTENCATNQLQLQYEFYTVDESAPLPKLDRANQNLLTSPTLPPAGLTPDQRARFDALLAELVALQRSELECPGDGNLDKRVDQADIDDWQFFADKCAQNGNQCSSVYDLNLDGITDTADLLIIEANFGRRCGVLGFLDEGGQR